MTGDLSVARRYASALFEVAKKRGEVEAVAANLSDVVTAATGSRELMSVLHHPLLPLEKKQSVLRAVFQGNVRPDVEKFLFLVVEKSRTTVLPQILSEFNRLVDEFKGEADAEAVSAIPLDAAQKAALETALQRRFGVRVRLQTRVDENILGGLIVRVGDKLIDNSVESRIRAASEQLKRVKVA